MENEVIENLSNKVDQIVENIAIINRCLENLDKRLAMISDVFDKRIDMINDISEKFMDLQYKQYDLIDSRLDLLEKKCK